MIKNQYRCAEPQSLSILCGVCAQAPAVYLAIIQSAKGRKSFVTSRLALFKRCGIPKRRITRLLTILDCCGWILREKVTKKTNAGFINKVRITVLHRFKYERI